MSVELPELERLLSDAAERHYGRRRPRLSFPRPAVALAVVVAAIVLAVAILPNGSDERAAGPPPKDQAAAAAEHFSVFAHPDDSGVSAIAIAEDQRAALDPREPFEARLLRQFPHGGIVALAGTSRIRGEPAVCLSEQHKHVGGGGCIDVADLPADEPWFTFGVPGQSDTTLTALVPDSITSMSIELAGGETRDVPIENNLAYAKAGENICSVRWETHGGGGGTGRSLPGC